MGEFPSGQRGQTVNLLAMPSMVRIHLPPPARSTIQTDGASCCVWVFVKMDLKGRRVRKHAIGTFSRRPGPSSDGRIHLPPPARSTIQTDGASCCVWVFVKMDSKGRRVRKRASGTFSRRPGPSSDGRIRLPTPRKTSFVFATREVFLSRLFLELTANLDYNEQKITFDGFSGTNRVQETRKHA